MVDGHVQRQPNNVSGQGLGLEAANQQTSLLSSNHKKPVFVPLDPW